MDLKAAPAAAGTAFLACLDLFILRKQELKRLAKVQAKRLALTGRKPPALDLVLIGHSAYPDNCGHVILRKFAVRFLPKQIRIHTFTTFTLIVFVLRTAIIIILSQRKLVNQFFSKSFRNANLFLTFAKRKLIIKTKEVIPCHLVRS